MSESLPIFDQPSDWRAEAVLALGLTGEDRAAGVATGAAYPLALPPIVRHLMAIKGGLLCDLGAGLGGPAAFMAEILGVRAIAVEASFESARRAAALFPQLAVVRASADAVPLSDGSCAALTLLGVVSLVESLAPVVDETHRLLQDGGQVGVTDLFLTDGLISIPATSPNTFRSVDLVVDCFEEAGFGVTEVSREDTDDETEWDEVGRAVDDEILRRHGDHPAFGVWRADHERLRRLIVEGRLTVASFVARRSCALRPSGLPSRWRWPAW